MRPAFSSTKQAAAFALLLLGIGFLPLLLRGKLLPPVRENYLQQGWDTFGDYVQLERQIFEDKEDIDIAFVGSSRIWMGIDAPYVQEHLSARLGRPAVVRTIAWGWSGYDKFYFMLRDLLQHRHVKMVVFNDEGQSVNLLDPFARRWFRLGDPDADFAGIPFRLQSDYFFAGLLGVPRNLLELIRPNLPCVFSETDLKCLESAYFCTNAVTGLGSLALRQGFNQSPVFQASHPPFEAFQPAKAACAADAVIFSPDTRDQFEFTGPPLLVSQAHYVMKTGKLVAQYPVRLIMVHVPEVADLNRQKIPERQFWPDIFPTGVTMLGIPPPKFFAGLSRIDAHKLFAEPFHLNQNGQQYFTQLITPSLINLYENSVPH